MATMLGTMSVGSTIKIKVNGAAHDFIIVHQGIPSSIYDDSCYGTWLLMSEIYAAEAWGQNYNFYKNSVIDLYLKDFYNLIDAETKKVIKTVKIPYHTGFGHNGSVVSGADGLSCNIFLLSGYEVGWTGIQEKYLPADGACLSYFAGTSFTDPRRTPQTITVNPEQWWLRSPVLDRDDYAWFVTADGRPDDTYVSNTNCGVRPAFILPTTLKVDSDGNLIPNSAPTITSSRASGSSMGEVSAPFSFTYKVADADNDTVTVKEYLDNVLQRSYTATPGATNTFQATYNSGTFQKILNGSHTIKVIATDSAGNSSSAYTVYFNKQVKTATITLSSPLPADDVIKAAAVTVTGSIPQDATLQILVTNNARDASPVWEDMTPDFEKQINHIFTNKTAANGFAFNFKVTAARGAGGTQGYISNIGGAFE